MIPVIRYKEIYTAERLRVAPVRAELLVKLLVEGNRLDNSARCVMGLPEGARLVEAFEDPHKDYVYFVFEHESFDAVADGAEIPAVKVMYEIGNG